MDFELLLSVVPAITLALSPTASLTTLNNFNFSSSESVGDSPVVPPIKIPSLPDFDSATARFFATS